MSTPAVLTPPYQTIDDRKISVAMKIGNRQDLLQPAPGMPLLGSYSRISGWLRDAYIETVYSRTFEQGEETFQFQTVAGQDSYVLPDEVRAPKALTGYDDNGTPIIMSWTSIAYLRRYSAVNVPASTVGQARPSLYTLWAQKIVMKPTPNASFTFFLDYWQKPLITDDVDSTPLLLPDDWLEVLDYKAAIRGNAELQQADRSREMQELLFGFTDASNGRIVPGLIAELQNREQAAQPYTDWGLQPQNRTGYTR